MARRRRVEPFVDESCLVVGDQSLPLYSGSLDYWRLDRERWSDLLDRARWMGLRVISTSAPWSIHEIAPGLYDFGERDERKDLDAFLSLCKERDLFVLLRPGPGLDDQLPTHGYPPRLFEEQEILALTAQGTPLLIPAVPHPHPLPSYASERFYGEVGRYFDALCSILVRHLAPAGCLIGLQVDSGLDRIFAQGPFTADYSPDAQHWYQEFLRDKYGEVDAMNRAYRTRYGGFEQVKPPRSLATREREALARYLDWIEFQEHYIARALNILASLLWARGVRGLLTYHTLRSTNPHLPLNVQHNEGEIDIQGVGLYLSRREYEEIRMGALYLSAVSRIPFLSEASAGTWPWGPSLTPTDQQFAILAAIMHGFRAFDIRMLVDREKWIGSPISPLGEWRDHLYPFLRRLLETLEELRLHTQRRQVRALLLRNLEYERLCLLCSGANWITTHLLGIPPDLLVDTRSFTFTQTIQLAYPSYWRFLYLGLTLAKIPFHIGDTTMPLEALSRYPLVLLPTYDYLSEPLQQRLLDYVDKGGTLMMGPEIPYLGGDMRTCTLLSEAAQLRAPGLLRPVLGLEPLNITEKEVRVGDRTAGQVAKLGRGRILYLAVSIPPVTGREDAAEAGDLIGKVASWVGLQPLGDPRSPLVDETYWGRRGTRVIFLANPTNQPQSVSVKVSQRAVLRDAWTGEEMPGRGPREMPLQPHQIRILEVAT